MSVNSITTWRFPRNFSTDFVYLAVPSFTMADLDKKWHSALASQKNCKVTHFQMMRTNGTKSECQKMALVAEML